MSTDKQELSLDATNPSLEEQASKQTETQAVVANDETRVSVSEADNTVRSTDEARPEWLPEKFKSPEDMANAYSELEKKMGAGANEDQQEQEEGETTNEEEQPDDSTKEDTNTNDVIVEASKEFFENDGVISEETYKNLAEIGLPKELVDSYAAGQQALQPE